MLVETGILSLAFKAMTSLSRRRAIVEAIRYAIVFEASCVVVEDNEFLTIKVSTSTRSKIFTTREWEYANFSPFLSWVE